MMNTYVLQQAHQKRLLDRNKVRLAVNIGCRLVTVLGFIGFIALPGGVESGAISILEWILLEVLMAGIVALGVLGETVSHVELPLDGGEGDE